MLLAKSPNLEVKSGELTGWSVEENLPFELRTLRLLRDDPESLSVTLLDRTGSFLETFSDVEFGIFESAREGTEKERL